MTARLSPQREAEIVEWRDLLGASHCAEDAGPHGALNDLLAELAAVRAERDEAQQQLAEYEPLNPQQCPAGKHTDWLVDSEYTHACPWCQIDGLKAELADLTEPDVDGVGRTYESYHPHDADPGRCLEVHAFSPRDGWRVVCGSCHHTEDAACHSKGGTS